MDRSHKYKILDKGIRIIIISLVFLFVIYPFFCVFLKAFYIDKNIDFTAFKFLKDENHLLINSIKTGFLTAIVSTFIATCIALLTLFTNKWGKRIIVFILLLTMVTPPFISSLTYIELFGRNGFITKHIMGLSLNPYGLLGIVSVQTLGFTSLNATLLIGYLDSFDMTMIESAKSLRASTTAIVKDIILPLMVPPIAVSVLLSFIKSVADFSTPMLIGGAFNTLATESYLSVIEKGNTMRAAAMSIVIFLPSIIVFFVYTYFLKRQNSASKIMRSSQVKLKKSGIYYIIAAVAVFFIIWISIQYIAIFMSSFTGKSKGNIYFTLDNIKQAIPYIKTSFIRSIVYSVIAGLIVSFLGLLVSYYSYLRGIKHMKILDMLSNLPYIIPGTFFGLGYIFAFHDYPFKLTGTAAIVILNLIFRQLPLAIRAVQSKMTQITKATINSSKDLGAHELNTFKDIVLPMSKQGLFLSFTNTFISSMTTIGSIIFLIYPNRKLATLVLFDLVSSGKYNIASVLSSVIIIICLIFSLTSYRLLHRRNNVFRDN